MSFRLRIDRAENLGGETRIRGRVIEGAYFGPQYIRLKDTTGKEWTTTILSHGLIGLNLGWPVTADHDTQLELHVASPAAPFAVDANSPLQGLGNVALRQGSTDLSRALSDPLFWGNFSTLYMVSDSMEQPYEGFLGLSQDEVNGYYSDFLSPLCDSAAWPIFPLEIDGDRYVEIEWAGGAESQERVWIGSRETGWRALLGYNSGHFSLPGLRPSELAWLLDRLEDSKAHPASGLLLVPMCYFRKPDTLLTERLTHLCTRVPGARAELASTISANMVENRVVPEVKWERRVGFGWCNSWVYSQRNPQSPMSVLSQAGFEFVDQFFSEIRDDEN